MGNLRQHLPAGNGRDNRAVVGLGGPQYTFPVFHRASHRRELVWDMSNTQPHIPDMPGKVSKEALEHGIWWPAGTGSVLEG